MSKTPLLACIDDDPSIREAIKGLLKASGFRAQTFSSAEEFLEVDRLENTSCLIMDVQLGGMSGLQLQNRLVESGYRIPIIFITAFPDERIRERALSAGAVCFLSKPVTKEGLLTCIHAALHRGDGTEHSLYAALSRSHFLRLSAGALLPFVGWRLPAAAAPNPELAQNSSGPGTKRAAGPGSRGTILVSQFGAVKIHSYLSPADGLQVNTQTIEGPNAVVIFDGQLLLPYADEVASYVQTLGKPIDRIILSHAHTDHWGGLQLLTERFSEARVFALHGIADQVRASGPARLDGLHRTYGDRAPTKVTVPTETITEGPQRIDGVTYDFRRFVDAESDLQLAVLLPEQKVLMAFDLVFSPNQHAFTGANHFDHWLIVLESLKALQGYDTIIIGHDKPVDRAAIDSTMTYVKRAKDVHAVSADAKTYSESLKAAFPELQLSRFADLSASYLYAAPR